MGDKHSPPEEMPDYLARRMSQWRQADPKATLAENEEAMETELARVRMQLIEGLVQDDQFRPAGWQISKANVDVPG